jgi:hypothetical protein
MSYGCSQYYCPGIPYFSNPDVSFAGHPTGVPASQSSSADNAATFDHTRVFAEQWRDAVGEPPPSFSPCDLNSDGATNVLDVQLCVNQALASIPCNSGDLNSDGLCNVVDVQRAVNAALGMECRVGP